MSSPDIDLVPEIQALAFGQPVVDKLGFTLFSDEGAALVRENGWSDLVFCGDSHRELCPEVSGRRVRAQLRTMDRDGRLCQRRRTRDT